ncbi:MULTISPECIES: hypothetical protein [unclassified Sporosarcina]|uniref:hypothetical protein n=1 Tax=unclassified Sporosarcina TaxID=2647733 RepID=UPI00203DA59E|nr:MULTISPECIES: hypothetical protein [unclassified Sporosarcina]GKV67113.1 hypothetical protein NCCP2331_32660 [Sporosarcina sp. NCCP-2331]GLB57412.1 hypothetical protein NCCP2378_32000 [Sporosarcina sp. NCCP-2378]
MSNKNVKVFKVSFISFMLLLTGVLFAACSNTEAGDPNAGIVEKVLKLQFNGPDEKIMDLLLNPDYTKVVDGKQVNEEFDQYVTEVYGDYFTEYYLIPFFSTSGLVYPTAAEFSGYELNLEDTVVKQTEKDSNRYTFTATVGYSKDGEEEKTADVSGVVLFSTKEKGKIGKFEYGEDNGLYKELSSGE